MTKHIFLLLTILMISCQQGDDCCINIESDIFIQVENQQGEDLLDPKEETINSDSIKVMYASQHGDKREVNNADLDAPKGYKLITPDADGSQYYKVQIFLNTEYFAEDNTSYTYVEWTAGDIDEIKTLFDTENNNRLASKIWINGVLQWKRGDVHLISLIK